MLYSNPINSGGILSISDEFDRISIIDVTGRLVLQKPLNGNNTIQLEGLSSGTYILRAIDKNGNINVGKLIVVE